MLTLTRESHPAIMAAREALECDRGGHLIGTVYPGPVTDFDRLLLRDSVAELIAPAEQGLARLIADLGEDGLEIFVCGEESEMFALRDLRGDLAEAHRLLNAILDGADIEPEGEEAGRG